MYDCVQYQIGTLPAGSLNFGGWSQHLPAANGTTPAAMPDAVVKYKKQLEANKTSTDSAAAAERAPAKPAKEPAVPVFGNCGYRLEKEVSEGQDVYYLVHIESGTELELDRSFAWTLYEVEEASVKKQAVWKGEPHDPSYAKDLIEAWDRAQKAKSNVGADGFAGAQKSGPGFLWAVCVGCVFMHWGPFEKFASLTSAQMPGEKEQPKGPIQDQPRKPARSPSMVRCVACSFS